MDPIFIPGSGYYNSGTEIESTSHSLSSTSYPHGEDEYGLKWKNGRDLIDSTVGPNDPIREKPVYGSPASSIHKATIVPRPGESSAVSSSHWNIRSPSGDQYRPEFPVSSSMVWDLLKTQDYFLDVRNHKKEMPPELANAMLPGSLAEMTPALLSTNGLIVDKASDAEGIYQCLRRNKVIKSTNFISVSHPAYRIEEMLTRGGIALSDFKLKKLEWLLGLLYDLDQFTREQFEVIHDPVPSKFWKSYFKTEYSVVGAWFGRGGFGMDKPSARTSVWIERRRYWEAERTWQRENCDESIVVGATAKTVGSAKPLAALPVPKGESATASTASRDRKASETSTLTIFNDAAKQTQSDGSVEKEHSAPLDGVSELSARLQGASINDGVDKR